MASAALLPRAGTEGSAAPRAALPTDAAAVASSDDVAVLLLARIARGARAWGWSRIVLGAWPLRGTPGLRFAKALGSGQQGGFGLTPSLSHQGLFALFDSRAAAEAFVAGEVVARYRARSVELCLLQLRAVSCRGQWGGRSIGVAAAPAGSGPVASLTRASIRPHKALQFWRHSPPAAAALQRAEGCLLAVGLGEAPLLRQATFSLWRDQAAMDAYARSGAHGQAIRGALQGGWFSESMFVRFAPLHIGGRWSGVEHA